MHNKNVRRSCNHCSFLQVNFPVASVTLIVTDNLTFDLLRQSLFNRLDTLNWDGKIEIVLHAILNFSTLSADHLTALLTTEDTLNKMLSRSFLKSVLKSIKENIKELLGVLLFGCVCWLTIKFFKSETELHWVEVIPFGELEHGEHLLHLMHHVVVNLLALVLCNRLWLAIVHT